MPPAATVLLTERRFRDRAESTTALGSKGGYCPAPGASDSSAPQFYHRVVPQMGLPSLPPSNAGLTPSGAVRHDIQGTRPGAGSRKWLRPLFSALKAETVPFPLFLATEFEKRPLRLSEGEWVVKLSLSGEPRVRETGAENVLGWARSAANEDNGGRSENSPTRPASAKPRPRAAYSEAPTTLIARTSVNHVRHRRTWRDRAAPRRRRFADRSRGSRLAARD